MSMVYKWRAPTTLPIPVQVAGEEIERIRSAKNGNLIAADVVAAAKRKGSVLHPVFEWDDRKAGHQWRLEQASTLVRNIVVVKQRPNGETTLLRAFVSVRDKGNPGYTSIDVAMSDPNSRAALVAQAWKELGDWRLRYEHLAELAAVFDLIDKEMAGTAATRAA